MKKYLAIWLIAIGLLFFGCIAPSEQETNKSGTTGAGNGTTGTSSSSGEPNTAQAAKENNLQGLSYEQIVAIGVPAECTYYHEENGIVTTMDLKIKGNKIRMTTVVDNRTNETASFILVDKKSYVSAPPKFLELGCTWLKITANQGSTPYSITGFNITEELTRPGTKLNCKPGAFGDEVFVPNGDVCDLDPLIEKMMERYQQQ